MTPSGLTIEASRRKIDWKAYYAKPARLGDLVADNLFHLYFILRILMLRPRSLLEVGCGPGHHGILLAKMRSGGGRKCLLDSEPYVLDKARRLSQAVHAEVEYIVADAFALPFRNRSFDVVFSQGLLEHFRPEQAELTLVEQIRVSRRAVVFSVPSSENPFEGTGDEQRRSVQEWKEISSRAASRFDDVSEIKTEHYLFDLGVRSRVQLLRRNMHQVPLHTLALVFRNHETEAVR